MNTYTAVLKGRQLSRVLKLPEEYLNAELEVKVRVLKKLPVRKPSKFDTFFGAVRVDNIEEEIRMLRDDWNQL